MNKQLAVSASGERPARGDRRINFWHSTSDSDTVLVLVHGIFSDGITCWSHLDSSAEVYWPDMIARDPRFGRPSIFVAGYHTAIDSGEFSIAQCAKQVFAALAREDFDSTPAVLTRRRIAFVCHSTGGIVVRYLIDRHRAAFKDAALGLALIASPSEGSVWANVVGLAARYYNQRLAQQLQVGNETLADLHSRFRDLVNARATELPGLFGMEACEHHMVGRKNIPSWLVWAFPPRLKIVSTRSAGQYFGDVTILPGTDHFSVVKPDSVHHPAHTFLVDFWSGFHSQAQKLLADGRSTAVPSETQSVAVRALPPVRVSMAALLCLQVDGRYLLVRNLHRSELFAPLGGVYKYHDGAIAALADFGFAPEGYAERLALEADLERDLRGYLAPENLGRFRSWFVAGTDRETRECLVRELKEELEEVGVDASLIAASQELTFVPMRTVSEGPDPTPYGHDQFRTFDVYEPDMRDAARAAVNRALVQRLFDAAANTPGLLIVDRAAIDRLRTSSGQLLAPTVDYFLRSSRRPVEPVPFGRRAMNEGIHMQFAEFVAARDCDLFRRCKVIGQPTLIHSVQKGHSESLVARVVCDDRPYTIKFYSVDSTYARKESWALLELQKRAIDVPGMIESRLGAPAFVVMETISGHRLSDLKSEIHSHLEGTIRAVERLREVTFGQYGEIVGEFAPIGNHDSLSAYVRASVSYYMGELQRHQAGVLRASMSHAGELILWAQRVLNAPQSAPLEFRSALAPSPCLCHSDVKLTDVIVSREGERNKYVIIDFDNVFALAPEFDLCKLHFSLLENDVDLGLDAFAEVVGPIYGVSASTVEASLLCFYPLMLFRLFAWGAARNHELLMLNIARAARRLMPSLQ